jgi:hypothetical protein
MFSDCATRPFALYVRNDNRRSRLVKLIATCSALDIDEGRSLTPKRGRSLNFIKLFNGILGWEYEQYLNQLVSVEPGEFRP